MTDLVMSVVRSRRKQTVGMSARKPNPKVVSMPVDGPIKPPKKQRVKTRRDFRREGALAIWNFWILKLRNRLGHSLPEGDTLTPRDFGYLTSFLKFLGTVQAVEELLEFVIDNWIGIRAKYPRANAQEVPNFFIIDCLKEDLLSAQKGTVNIDKKESSVGGIKRAEYIDKMSDEEIQKMFDRQLNR